LHMCKFVKLLGDEEHMFKSNRGRTKTLTDSTRKRHKKEDSANIKKRCYADLLHFSTRKNNLLSPT
jgi:hypothetical protein